jgi:FKBP-type peptidyl-prolyl cis-trans isomerase
MKKITVFICLCLFAALPFTLHARAIQEDYRAAEEKARVSYAFGMVVGSNMLTDIEFDYDAFTQGFRASMEASAESQFSDQEALEIVQTALYNAMLRTTYENRRIEEEFLFLNGQRSEVHVTASGLQYEVLEASQSDNKPQADSIVRVNYSGNFINGNIFDSSEDEEGGVHIPLQLVIPGWAEGLMLMNQGSIYRIYIPSHLAYGREGIQGIIPPYSVLIFTVELLEIINDTTDEGFFYY